jgi:ATP-dependent DNA helicase DinG
VSDDLDLILAPGGLLARADDGYEDRPQQREMARHVLEALSGGRHLVVEAGTGTGKTLAYLVPAILSGRKVVVSTATRALQEQIFKKDLPLIAEKLGLSFRAACMKGRANYVCLLRKERFDAQPLFPFREDGALYESVTGWLRETPTGDIAELVDVPEDWATWREIVSTTETCTGQRCEHFESCFIVKLRAEAAAADVVVVNHHLFFADLALRTSSAGEVAGAEVIPRYDAVIFDEAHAIEDIATTFFGASLSNHRLRDLARDTARAARSRAELTRILSEAAARLDERGERFFVSLNLPDGRERVGPEVFASAEDRLDALREALDLLASATGRDESDDELFALERRARELRGVLDAVVAVGTPGQVHWSEVRRGGVYLHASPIDAAGELQERLLRRVDACVFTSATLSTGGSLGFFQDRMGLCAGGEALYEQEGAILPSPFDYERQAALYVPEDFPEPSDPDFAAAVADEVVALCALTGGRAFVLCTSHRNMDAIHRLLDGRLDWPLLKQGQAPKGALLERFRAEPTVLVATQSFWEGVDVPGDALSLVIVDKLPFAPPNDPVLAARMDALRARGRSPFSDLQVPQAALALKQGFGRLIRTRRDRGIVAVCDVRLAEKGYRGHFLRTLPPCPRFRRRTDLAHWWRPESG